MVKVCFGCFLTLESFGWLAGCGLLLVYCHACFTLGDE
jgi:hypothetical protein